MCNNAFYSETEKPDRICAGMVCRQRIIFWKTNITEKMARNLRNEGPAFGYVLEPMKSYLIVDEGYISQAKILFEPRGVNVVSGPDTSAPS